MHRAQRDIDRLVFGDQLDLVAHRHRLGLIPDALGKLLHALGRRLTASGRCRHRHHPQAALDVTQRGVEVHAHGGLQQLEAATRAALTAVVVPLTELVGVLEPIRATAQRARQVAALEIYEQNPKLIIFYNYNYELDILKSIFNLNGVDVAEWNGHKHQPVPDSDKWVYLVHYSAGAEGWNCIKTDAILFYSLNYSFKIMSQAEGRIDRLNTPFKKLYYFYLKSNSTIDLAVGRALSNKKKFNELDFYNK